MSAYDSKLGPTQIEQLRRQELDIMHRRLDALEFASNGIKVSRQPDYDNKQAHTI